MSARFSLAITASLFLLGCSQKSDSIHDQFKEMRKCTSEVAFMAGHTSSTCEEFKRLNPKEYIKFKTPCETIFKDFETYWKWHETTPDGKIELK